MYAKVFVSLYQGTLRGNAHGILVFTNLMAHADKDGIVDMHPRAIAEEVGLPIEAVKAALLQLEAPDEESRSPECEGRRIVRLDEHRIWGWQIVNHGKYRAIKSEDDRREQNRAAQERYREKNKQPSAIVSNSKQSSAGSAHTETETETETEAKEQEHAQPSVAPPVVELEIVPDGIKRAKREPTAARFDEFWAIYPVRKGKDAALAKWKARGYDQIADQIITDVRKRMLHDRQWLAGFVPHGSTYVNGRGWQDDVEADQKPQATKHGAADDFRGKQYDGTDLSKLPPELRAAIEADLGA